MLRVSTAVTSGKAWPSNAFQGILSGGDPGVSCCLDTARFKQIITNYSHWAIFKP